MKKISKNIYKFRSFIYATISLLVLLSFILMNMTNDGMNNDKNIKLYYKTYTNKWTFWSRDGLISGNKKDNIKDIRFKISCDKKCTLKYNKKNKIIKIKLDNKLSDKYIFCYRTYNKKWNNWYCKKSIRMNDFTAFEAKIIPNDVEKNDWLKK